MAKRTLSTFHEALVLLQKRVNARKRVDKSCGICGNIEAIVGHGKYNVSIKIYGKAWPEHSGNSTFPIPAPAGYVSPCSYDTAPAAYYLYGCKFNYWTGEYGAARKRMLAFLVEATKPSK